MIQLLAIQDVDWWTGVVWIIVMFLSDSHSDGTHSLQSIHCWDTDAMLYFIQIWWRNKHIYILDGLRVSIFLANSQQEEILSIGINFREKGAHAALWQALFFVQ